MTDRERLIELIQPVLDGVPWGEVTMWTAQDIANNLLRNGVTVAPMPNTIKYALDLINRQKAEIERLNADYEKLQIKYENVENELKYQQRIYKTAKAEAIKEFAERLKAIYGEWLYSYKIDDLVKEMIGE